ncbi:MAG: hypothetical protein AAGK78_07920, partial [Planctomycetota bacterium]
LLQEVNGVQQVAPISTGAGKFSPVSADAPDGTFGLWIQTPTFIDDGRSRVVYSQDQFNTWEPTLGERDKVVAYPAIRSNGETIPNAYIVAFEEFQNASDYNDIVAVLTNVRPVAVTEGRLAVLNEANVPSTDRVILSTIDPAGRDNSFGTQQVRDSQTVTVRNVGTQPITIDGATTTGPFSVTGLATGSLAVGSETTFTVNFTATSAGSNGGVYEGGITINTTGGPDASFDAGGFWQPYSENTGGPIAEPTFEQLVQVFGFDIDVGTPAELDNNGARVAVGDEVLSDYWRAAGSDVPVEVYQLAAFHNINTNDSIRWYEEGGPGSLNQIFAHSQNYAQSVIPDLNATSAPAADTFTPGDVVFGFNVNGEFSDDDLNGGAGDGHRLRFYPFRDDAGRQVADTWLMAMDFDGFNYDYNDNIYLIRGIRPAGSDAPFNFPAAPLGGNFVRINDTHTGVFWGRPEGVDGYTVYRSEGDRDSFSRVNTGLYFRNYLVTSDLPAGTDVWYRIFGAVGDGATIQEGAYIEVQVA